MAARPLPISGRALAALLILIAASAFGSFRFGGTTSPTGYTDFCSQSFIGGSCIYVYDLNQRRVSANTTPFTLTRISDSATLNGSYTGSSFNVNVGSVISFCLGNGGTTTIETYGVQYNDCAYTKINNQTGMGCDLVGGAPYNLTSATAHAPLVQVRNKDGKLASITPGNAIAGTPAVPYTAAAAKYLFSNGCTLADGGAARTLVALGSNAFYGDVTHASGEYGRIETNPAPGNVPAGSAMNTAFFVSGGFSDYGADIEGGGLCNAGSPFSTSPTVDVIGVITYSSTAGGSNIWYNNVQTGPVNCTPHSAINTQDGIVIGCSGDYTLCNNNYFMGMAILNIDASLTAGLPGQIYTALQPPANTDFCSQSFVAGSCVYVYDVQRQRVASNTNPFQVELVSNSTTHNAVYTGQNVDITDLDTFCISNGGTKSTVTYTASDGSTTFKATKYSDCVFSTLYDQNGSGCDLVAGGPSSLGTTHAPPYQVRLSDNLPAIIQNSQNPATNPSAKWLYKNGCASLDGNAAKTLVSIGSNAYFSGCCGQYGKIETAPAPGNVPAGSMYSVTFYHNGGTINFGGDIEGGGLCVSNTTTTLTPVVDNVGLLTYSTTAGGSNTYLNNSLLGPSNCTPFAAINTQDGMVVGCSGDYTACGPLLFRGMVFLNVDASLTAGLPTQIYNALP